MDNLLSRYTNKFQVGVVCLFSAVVTCLTLWSIDSVYAANYKATMTGYAHAYLSGSASGANLFAGNFANHAPNLCPGDPAAYWSWNTNITMVSPSSVPFRFSNNSSYTRSSFVLKDNGNPSCSLGNYWADIYFSHAKNPTSGCNCDGFTSCTSGSNNVNNCDQAEDWGIGERTYIGP